MTFARLLGHALLGCPSQSAAWSYSGERRNLREETCHRKYQMVWLAQESVGRKRRSCSGSRNGTPAVRDRRSASVGIDVSAILAEDSALNASLAAAEAAAQHAEKQVQHQA